MNVKDLFPGNNSEGFSRELYLSTTDHGLIREDIIEATDIAFFDKYAVRNIQLLDIPFDNLDIPLDVLGKIGSNYRSIQVDFTYEPNRIEETDATFELRIILFPKNTGGYTSLEYSDEGDFVISFINDKKKDTSSKIETIPRVSMQTVAKLFYNIAVPTASKLAISIEELIGGKTTPAAFEIFTEMLSSMAKCRVTTDELARDVYEIEGFTASTDLKRRVTETGGRNERMFSVAAHETFDIDTPNNNQAELLRTLTYEFYPDVYKEYEPAVFEESGSDLDDHGTTAELAIQTNLSKYNPTDDIWLRKLQQNEIASRENDFYDKINAALLLLRKKIIR